MGQDTLISNEPENEWKAVAVPLDDAQSWVNNWINANTISKEAFKPTDLRAFVVRRSDFVELLNQVDTEYVRMYIGLKPDSDSASGFEPCLVLASAAVKWTTVPETTAYDGPDRDNIIDLIGEESVFSMKQNQLVTSDYNVFDITRPCPPICDPSSDLFVPSTNGDQSC